MASHSTLGRRKFLSGLSAGLVGLTVKAERSIQGSFVNEAWPLGHRLRDHASFSAPKQQVRIPLVIVGGGMAGLSAAWHLDKRGFRDFVLLEMEPRAGGNSRWGQNEITRYPWAAHYIPVPARQSVLVRELLEEFGVLRDGKWDERTLCFAPQERLFLNGRWQEGIEPDIGLSGRDRAQFQRFANRMKEFRSTGEFTIPMQSGARPNALDSQSMAAWLAANQFDSSYLRWYIDYACRDDYGALARDTSAWAGVHYFASRDPEERGPLTWPEGNGWIARHLLEKLGRYVRTGAPVYRISRAGTLASARLRVFTEAAEYQAEAVIFAAPTFIAPYIIEDAPPAAGFEYSPWLTANLTLERLPNENDSELAWDNVIYDSPGLGYVDATHMSLASQHERSVWTYYWSLAEQTPSAARRLLLEKDWGWCKETILRDLERAHPDIRSCVSRIDVMRIGHAMARPKPGWMFSAERERWLKPVGRVWFANSDLSGFSIFEEAQYRGVEAAQNALHSLGL